MSKQPIRLSRKPPSSSDRKQLVKWAKILAWLGVGWHGIEAAVAVGAGIVASSIVLIGFGAESLIDAVAGVVLLWRLAASRAASDSADRRAQKLTGLSFYLLAAYMALKR